MTVLVLIVVVLTAALVVALPSFGNIVTDATMSMGYGVIVNGWVE